MIVSSIKDRPCPSLRYLPAAAAAAAVAAAFVAAAFVAAGWDAWPCSHVDMVLVNMYLFISLLLMLR